MYNTVLSLRSIDLQSFPLFYALSKLLNINVQLHLHVLIYMFHVILCSEYLIYFYTRFKGRKNVIIE
jgi:hypothetical protein